MQKLNQRVGNSKEEERKASCLLCRQPQILRFAPGDILQFRVPVDRRSRAQESHCQAEFVRVNTYSGCRLTDFAI